jgi:hypothetical protein
MGPPSTKALAAWQHSLGIRGDGRAGVCVACIVHHADRCCIKMGHSTGAMAVEQQQWWWWGGGGS